MNNMFDAILDAIEDCYAPCYKTENDRATALIEQMKAAIEQQLSDAKRLAKKYQSSSAEQYHKQLGRVLAYNEILGLEIDDSDA